MSRPAAAMHGAMTVDPLAGPRKAALLLHAMPAESRLWVLSQLPATQADVLRDLLAELRELAIPADQELLYDVLSDTAARGPNADNAPDAETQSAIIEQAGPGSVWLALRDEPAGLIARFLAVFEWRWENALLELFGPSKRHQIQRLLTQFRGDLADRTVSPDLLRAHLLAKLSAKLEDLQTRWVLDQTLASARGSRSRFSWRRPRIAARQAQTVA